MKPALRAVLASSFFLGFAANASAGELTVAPVMLETTAPNSAATLTLRNLGTRPINAQIRVFRWTQEGGKERLEPTKDVVVSPPMTSLPPRQNYLVRVVRVAKTPVAREESYRLLVDELPEPGRRENGTVSLVMRYSIPMFFVSGDARTPDVAWKLERDGPGLRLTGANKGDKHLRLANVRLKDRGGATVSLQDGLVGYVLGGASMNWSLARANGEKLASGPTELLADSTSGPIHATVTLQGPR